MLNSLRDQLKKTGYELDQSGHRSHGQRPGQGHGKNDKNADYAEQAFHNDGKHEHSGNGPQHIPQPREDHSEPVNDPDQIQRIKEIHPSAQLGQREKSSGNDPDDNTYPGFDYLLDKI